MSAAHAAPVEMREIALRVEEVDQLLAILVAVGRFDEVPVHRHFLPIRRSAEGPGLYLWSVDPVMLAATFQSVLSAQARARLRVTPSAGVRATTAFLQCRRDRKSTRLNSSHL